MDKMENERSDLILESEKRTLGEKLKYWFRIRPKNPRLEWLDQFRGLVVIMLIISTYTWFLSGDLSKGLIPIGSTALNHGWKYSNLEDQGWPTINTIIDIGQQIFIFIVGFVTGFSFKRRMEKEGNKKAWLHTLRRFAILMLLSWLDEGVASNGFNFNQYNWYNIFWYGTLGNLAWASISASFAFFIIKKPDHRIIIGFIIMMIHFGLYFIEPLREWQFTSSEGATYFKFPWNTINHIAIAIIGTSYFDYFQKDEKADPSAPIYKQYPYMKERVLPLSTLAFVLFYILDFFQYAEHRHCTTALALTAIGTSGFVLFVFLNFEQYGYKIPMLSKMGKNLLFLFIFGLVLNLITDAFDHLYLQNHIWVAVLVIGIGEILIAYLVAWILDRYNIIIKF
ncbi:MAG: hypothetical protein ACTSWX_13550 [Promethearchaeota archaeon]